METGKEIPGRRVGRILAGITLLSLLAEGVLRLFPIAPFCFRAWEAARHERARRAAFTVNFRFERERSFGDLSNMGNLPGMREFHPERFTADSLGFRNPAVPSPESPPVAIVLGSSFSGGAGLSDEDTISRQLGDRLGDKVYSAAGVDLELDEIRALARRLGMKSGWILCEHTSRDPLPVRPAPGTVAKKHRPSRSDFWSRIGRRLKDSRLQILCGRIYRMFQDDVILPNTHRQNIAVRTLIDGRSMLFLPWVERPPYQEAEIREGVAYWKWMAEELARDDLKLALFLVPDKHLVYAPLLEGDTTAFDEEGRSLSLLEKELAEAGVPVVNPLEALQKMAAVELREGRTIYAVDDTHWKASAIQVVADGIVPLLWR